MMKVIQKVQLSIADIDMHSSEFLISQLCRNDFRHMVPNHIFKPTLTEELVSFNSRFIANGFLSNPIDSFHRNVLHNFHFNILALMVVK